MSKILHFQNDCENITVCGKRLKNSQTTNRVYLTTCKNCHRTWGFKFWVLHEKLIAKRDLIDSSGRV